MNADDAAGLLIQRVRSRPWGLAVAAIAGDEVSIKIDFGADPLDRSTSFQWGSITKTLTGVLVGYALGKGELTPDTTLGAILEVAGPAAGITVAELATQRSGLPRLPPNLDTSTVDRNDPYAAYTEADLMDALATCDLGPRDYEYSNFGFMTLGRVLAVAAGKSYAELVRSRVLDPLSMDLTGCPPSEVARAPGYSGASRVPWWSTPLPGAGGVGGPITDLAAYLQAHLDPPPGALGDAISTATTLHAPAPNAMGYGWGHQGGGWFHDGGTGGFRSFVAFHRPSATAVALLANSAQADVVTQVGFATLTEMVKDAA